MQVLIRGLNYLPTTLGFIGIYDVRVAVLADASVGEEGGRGGRGCGLRRYMIAKGVLQFGGMVLEDLRLP
jgi:hypothetical protein